MIEILKYDFTFINQQYYDNYFSPGYLTNHGMSYR